MSIQKSQIDQESLLESQDIVKLSPLETLIDRVGGQSRYQFMMFLIFGMMWFVTSWLLVGQAFFFDDSYQCVNGLHKQQCSDFICGLKPDQRKFEIKNQSKSIVFEFQNKYMICQFSYIATILQSMVYLGSLTGFFGIPYIADNWGRRIALTLSWSICTFGVLMVVISDSQNMVGIGYFFAGFGANPAITLGYTFINEQVLGKRRQIYGVAIQIFLAVGEATIGLIFLSSLEWYEVGYILLSLCVCMNLMIFYLIESPKFLIPRNKNHALIALNKIAVRNNRQKLTIQDLSIVGSDQSQINTQGSSTLDLFRYKSLRWKSFATGIVFMSIQVIYYSTSLNIGKVGSNIVVNQVIVSISQGAGYISAQFIVNKWRRKITSIAGMAISGLCCLILLILDVIENDSNKNVVDLISVVMLLINRFILCSVWVFFYVYLAQIYPTSVKSLGLGWASAMGTVGSAASPYLLLIANKGGFSSWVFPGVFGIAGAAAGILLNETFKQPIPEEIQQKVRLIQQQSEDNNQTKNLNTSIISN